MPEPIIFPMTREVAETRPIFLAVANTDGAVDGTVADGKPVL
jgi:hypothetical protein